MTFKTERNFRCSCCNKVASDDISSDPFELDSNLYFRKDPHDETNMLCSDCIESINDASREFDDKIVFEDWEGGEIV